MGQRRAGGRPARILRPPEDAAKIREMPGPRRQRSAIAPLLGRLFAWPYRFVLAGFYRAGVLAWQLTLLSVVTNSVVGWLIVRGDYLVAGLLLILAGVFDIVDGGVARLRGEASPAGAFLDSVTDRVSDLIVFGCLFWAEAGAEHRSTAALALSALIVSLLVSHVRAEAESLRVALSEGLMQRLERYVALIAGLTIPRSLLPLLVVLTALGGVTVLQRAYSGWRQLGAERSMKE